MKRHKHTPLERNYPLEFVNEVWRLRKEWNSGRLIEAMVENSGVKNSRNHKGRFWLNGHRILTGIYQIEILGIRRDGGFWILRIARSSFEKSAG